MTSNNKKPKLFKTEEARVYEQWLTTKGQLPKAFDPENEFRDNVIVAQEGHVRLLYSAEGERYEVDSRYADYREWLVILRSHNDEWLVGGLCGPFQQQGELFAVEKNRADAEREQFWAAQQLYRKVLGRHGLPDNCLLAQYR